ncbi:organic cation transporter protein-like [Ornithodoros turicata]|uniref:organic cation transporter protein-like n=1 Tax=Ornithodoros turicata TaxID=34597 RepID=UPI003139D752
MADVPSTPATETSALLQAESRLREQKKSESTLPSVEQREAEQPEPHDEVTPQPRPKKPKQASPIDELVQAAPPSVSDECPSEPASVYGHGCYQWMTLFCSQLALLVFVSQQIAFAVISRPIDHWCKPPERYAGLEPSLWKNISIPMVEGRYSECTEYDTPRSEQSNNGTTRPCTSWDYENCPESVVCLWNLVCDRGILTLVEEMLELSGGMIAVPIAGVISDAHGRRPVVLVSVVILIAAGFAAAFTKTFVTFVVFRWVVSGATSTVYITMFILLFEVTTCKMRFFHCTAINFGGILGGAFIVFLETLHLRTLVVQLILIIPAVGLLCTFIMISESPRWLVAKQDMKRAEVVMLWATKLNGINTAEGALRFARFRKYYRKNDSNIVLMVNMNIVDLMRSDILRMRSVILFGCSLSLFLVVFQFLLAVRSHASFEARLLGLLWNIVAYVVSYFVMERFGRRNPLSYSMIGLFVALMCLAICHAVKLTGHVIDAIIWTEDAFLNVAVTVIYVYAIELYPTVMRSAAASSTFVFGRVGSLLAPLLYEFGKHTHRSVPLVLSAVLCLASGIFTRRLPDTLQLAISDIETDVGKDNARKDLLNVKVKPIKKKRTTRQKS